MGPVQKHIVGFLMRWLIYCLFFYTKVWTFLTSFPHRHPLHSKRLWGPVESIKSFLSSFNTLFQVFFSLPGLFCEKTIKSDRQCQNMSLAMRKPDFCVCKNKGADQLRSNCTADQCLVFRYMDSTISLLLKSNSSF